MHSSAYTSVSAHFYTCIPLITLGEVYGTSRPTTKATGTHGLSLSGTVQGQESVYLSGESDKTLDESLDFSDGKHLFKTLLLALRLTLGH